MGSSDCITDFYKKLFERNEVIDVPIAIVVSQGNGTEYGGDNQLLADIAKRIQSLNNIKLVVQREVYWAAMCGLTGIIVGHPSRENISVQEMLDQAVNICWYEKVSTVLLICHPSIYSSSKKYLENKGLTVCDF